MLVLTTNGLSGLPQLVQTATNFTFREY